MNILGQDNVIKFIDNCTVDIFPRTCLLLGDIGSGRHTIVNYISSRFSLPTCDISDKLTPEMIETMYSKVEPYMYIINMKELTIKDQISLLKFIEEPLKNAFICIIASNQDTILPTVFNRCYNLTLSRYTKDILTKFIAANVKRHDLVLRVSKTPGQVIVGSQFDLESIFDLCNKIVTKLDKASLTNTLSISEKLAYKNEKDKIDVDIFTKMLSSCIVDNIKDTNNNYSIELFKLNQYMINKLYVKNVNKKYIVEQFLVKAWQLYHNEA